MPEGLDWFDNDAIRTYSKMGDPTTTAQVHPYLFTTSMADLAVAAGTTILYGSATSLDYTGHGVKGVHYTSKATNEPSYLPRNRHNPLRWPLEQTSLERRADRKYSRT